jgi:capsular polysaccharide biosynthesis protein
MNRSKRRHKALVELRRRGWVVLVTMLVTLAAALIVAQVAGSTFTAEAVLVVRATGEETDEASSSPKLAATYATLIPLDPRIERSITDRVDTGDDWSFLTTNDPNTALLHLTVTAETEDVAIAGATIAANNIVGSRPVSRNIAPNTVAIAKLPRSADESGVTTQLLVIVALVLGFLLGCLLLAFWRAGDARIDAIDELDGLLQCPRFEVHFRRKSGFGPLFDALGNRMGRTIAVVPCRERDQLGLKALTVLLRNAFGKDSVAYGGVPGSAAAGELTAVDADVTVLVMTPGVRQAELKEAIDALGRYMVPPSYAVLAVEAHGRGSVAVDRTADSSRSVQTQ